MQTEQGRKQYHLCTKCYSEEKERLRIPTDLQLPNPFEYFFHRFNDTQLSKQHRLTIVTLMFEEQKYLLAEQGLL
jgi:hypothetical protein